MFRFYVLPPTRYLNVSCNRAKASGGFMNPRVIIPDNILNLYLGCVPLGISLCCGFQNRIPTKK